MSSKQLKWFLLIVLALIWGSSFILIKRGLVALTPFQLGSLRIIFAAVFLLIIGLKSLALIPLGKWKYIVLTAFFGTFLPVYLFSFAQTEINSSVSAILNSLTPLYTLLLGAFAFGLLFERRQLFGVIVGLIGCVLLIFNGAINNPGQNYYYAILVVIASVCYAVNVNLIKKYLSDLTPLSITTGNFTILLIPALLVLSFTDFFAVVQQPEVQHSIVFILILGIVGTGIANIIFFRLIQMSSPIFASSVTYLIPIVAFFWGLLDNESLSLIQFLGAFIILFGVYLSARK
ncbi:DMT family transporter [Flavobacterium sp.]|uniref:DMT family transporter n=1 Tax=Flavobacterium sp. TaxID=239 RepID=UPI002B4B0A90|nr:DMT family transporter [Flavobacterium sp.]HLF51010.1 DMT family transporter [Flavobacterium sp.]